MLSSIPVSQSRRPPTAEHQQPPQTWTAAGVNSDEDDEGCRPFTPPPARERLSYTRYQLELLNGIYENIRYPNSTQKQLIAKRVGITREQVKVWFQNRRRKDVLGSSKCRDFPSLENGLQEAEALQDTRSSCLVPVLVMNSIVTELRKFKDNPYKSKKSSTKLRKSNRLHAATAAAAPCMVKKSTEDSVYRSAYDIVSPPNQITPTAFSSRMPTQLNHSESSSAFYNPKDTHLDSLAAAAYGRQGKYAEIEAETENRMNPASSQQCYEDFNFWGLAPKMYNTQTSTFGHVPQQMIYGETNRFDITCGGYLDVPYRPTMQFPFRTDQQRWTGKRQFDSHTLYQQHTPHSLPLGESREELSNASLGTNSTDIQISELRFSLPDAANFLSYN